MAQTLTISMSRTNAQPWGFRLQGGLDFATPLTVLRVNIGSLAEAAGLMAGDTILRVDKVDALRLRHQEALDLITKSGNQFQLLVSRAGIWKPQVTPLAQPVQVSSGETLLTKTSLALRHEENLRIGSGHNSKAAPFSPSNKYTEESIAETLTSQAEVLAKGVIGVDFKKNEKVYDSSKSQVFKMLQEMDKEPKEEPEPSQVEPSSVHMPTVVYESSRNVSVPPSVAQTTTQNYFTGTASVMTSSAPAPVVAPKPSGVRSVAPPVANKNFKGPEPPQATADSPRCGECDRLIVGVFVRLKEKNLHVECFKCSTCGTSLKNVGYYKINNKLYCDVHARLVASHQPPAPDLAPITVNPGLPVPKDAMTTEMASAAGTKKLGASLAAMSLSSGPPPVGGVRIFPSSPFKLH